jgi:hypothetical protein
MAVTVCHLYHVSDYIASNGNAVNVSRITEDVKEIGSGLI